MGSLLGMYVAMNFIQAKLNPLDTAGRANLSDSEFEAIKEYDLSVLIRSIPDHRTRNPRHLPRHPVLANAEERRQEQHDQLRAYPAPHLPHAALS